MHSFLCHAERESKQRRRAQAVINQRDRNRDVDVEDRERHVARDCEGDGNVRDRSRSEDLLRAGEMNPPERGTIGPSRAGTFAADLLILSPVGTVRTIR